MSLVAIASTGVAVALGLLVAGSGLAKLRTPRSAVAAIDAYGLVPARGLPVLVPVLALLELVAGVAIASPPTRAAGAIAVLTLLLMYTTAIAIAFARGRGGSDCGCGGLARGVPIGGGVLVRNAVLIAATLACASPRVAPLQGAGAWLAAFALALLALGLYHAANFLLARERLLSDD